MTFRPILIPVLVLCTTPALGQTRAQQAPVQREPTVEDYLCTFAGKCDGVDAPVVTRDAPQTKGFRLARPTSGPATKPAAETGGYSGGYGKAEAKRIVGRPGRKNRSYTNVDYPHGSASGVAVPGRARADLMIGFELNSARLTPEGVHAAQIFAKSLMMPELKTKRFLIEGHTDVRGGRGLNMKLSRQRAAVVANYLISLGVTSERLETRGFGPDVPLPGRSTSDPNNRRVEAELLS